MRESPVQSASGQCHRVQPLKESDSWIAVNLRLSLPSAVRALSCLLDSTWAAFGERMQTRRFTASCALVAFLLVCGISATAEERSRPVLAGLSSTIISGYVDSSVWWDMSHPVGRIWWRTFFHSLRLHMRF